MICEDFNSQVGDNTDYIKWMDDIPERSVLHFESNSYCDKFLDLLISANCCVLNGRAGVCVQDNYTYVSSKGKSDVDYCIVPYESLHLFSQFKVHLALDMFRKYSSSPLNTRSLTTYMGNGGCDTFTSINNGNCDGSFIKYNTSDISYNFMLSEESITATDQALENHSLHKEILMIF